MKTFSERYVTPVKALQVESMDETLQISLWICLESLFDDFSREVRDIDSARANYINLMKENINKGSIL